MKEILASDPIHLERSIYSVSQLNLEVRFLLEENFPSLWVEGEISNLRDPGSGHLYFTLKDSRAQIRCALFRSRAGKLGFQPKDGMQVLAKACISLYEERGDFQLIVEHLEEAGDGALRRSFEILKKRLAAEGLFAVEKKQAIPQLPNCVGVITSATGAAVRDILAVLKRRFPATAVIIYPTQVQGAEAAKQIVKAISRANGRRECDVLILARGGGSLEDLWPFNEEIVARAIYASQIPTVSAIGHEIDFTIADFVADQRAATPSAAAELVTPDITEWLTTLERLRLRLLQGIRTLHKHMHLVLQALEKRLPHPKRRLQDQAQSLDGLQQRLMLAQQHFLRHKRAALAHRQMQLQQYNPRQMIRIAITRCQNLEQRLKISYQHLLSRNQQKLMQLMRALDGVSPLNTLNRGYAIVMKEDKILRSVQDVSVGETINARLALGVLECIVSDRLDIRTESNTSLD